MSVRTCRQQYKVNIVIVRALFIVLPGIQRRLLLEVEAVEWHQCSIVEESNENNEFILTWITVRFILGILAISFLMFTAIPSPLFAKLEIYIKIFCRIYAFYSRYWHLKSISNAMEVTLCSTFCLLSMHVSFF